MTTISPIKYEVEIQEPLSAPVPMPPSMLSSEALVIWMFRIAMNAPIMAANTAIQVVRLARPEPAGAAAAGFGAMRGAAAEDERARLDMTSPLGNGIDGLRGGLGRRGEMGDDVRPRL